MSNGDVGRGFLQYSCQCSAFEARSNCWFEKLVRVAPAAQLGGSLCLTGYRYKTQFVVSQTASSGMGMRERELERAGGGRGNGVTRDELENELAGWFMLFL